MAKTVIDRRRCDSYVSIKTSETSAAPKGESEMSGREIEARAAAAIEGIRSDLEDCTFDAELRKRAMKVARDFACALAHEHYDGISVVCDPEDGGAEVIIDNFSNKRRLTVDLRADKMLRVSQISKVQIQRSGWVRSLYAIPTLATWLLAR